MSVAAETGGPRIRLPLSRKVPVAQNADTGRVALFGARLPCS